MTSPARIALIVIAAVILLAAGPLFLPPFYVRVGQLMLYSAGLGLAWAILGGFAGYASFGHSAFIGIGAFAAGLIENQYSSLPPTLLLPLGLVTGAIVHHLADHPASMAARVDVVTHEGDAVGPQQQPGQHREVIAVA